MVEGETFKSYGKEMAQRRQERTFFGSIKASLIWTTMTAKFTFGHFEGFS
jgi:hypothetical protein